MDDVFNAGYEIPAELGEVKDDSFKYYRHADGVYTGYIGRLNLRYKDSEDKKCEPDFPGAKLTGTTLVLWIVGYLGTPDKPVTEKVLGKDLIVPQDGVMESSATYFPLTVPIQPKEQWKNIRMFEDFTIPNHDSLRIIKVNPDKPTEKFTNFKSFPHYFGAPVSFVVGTHKTKAGDKEYTIVDSIKLMQTEWSAPDKLNAAQAGFEELRAKEIAKRKTAEDSGYQPPAPPQTDLDALLGNPEDVGEYS